jgi:hypothetical protein
VLWSTLGGQNKTENAMRRINEPTILAIIAMPTSTCMTEIESMNARELKIAQRKLSEQATVHAASLAILQPNRERKRIDEIIP